jgi:hypothetical protein
MNQIDLIEDEDEPQDFGPCRTCDDGNAGPYGRCEDCEAERPVDTGRPSCSP